MPLELPSEIASTIPAEHLSHEAIQRYNSPAELIKGHIEQRDMISRSIGLPKNGDDLNKWRTETGEKLKGHGFTVSPLTEQPPVSPDAYDFKVEGVDAEAIKSDVVVPAFRTWAHKQGMNNAQANAALEFYTKEVVPMLSKKFNEAQGKPPEMIEGEAAVEKAYSSLPEKQWGDMKARREEASRAVESLSKDNAYLKDFLEGTAPFGNAWITNKDHPGMVHLLSEVARLQMQDFGGNVDGAAIQGDALAAKKEADDIIGNKENPNYSKYWKGDKEIVEKVESLYRKAHQGR